MRLAVLTLFLSLFISFVFAAKTTTLQVEPQTEECLFIDNTDKQLVTIQFTVSRGGKLDINLVVTDPSGNVIHKELYFFDEHREDFMGNYQFSANSGTYSICFDNKMARYTAKVVSFKVSTPQNPILQELDSSKRLENAAKKGDLDPLEYALSRINTGLLRVEEEQKHYRIREQSHRDLADVTAGKVFWFSVVECAVLGLAGLAQIFFLRRWFGKSNARMA